MSSKKDILLSGNEWKLLRHSLDTITINGKDAKMVANLQDKLDGILSENTPPVK
jgi:hypothetical protein